jgi:hypothetical protein
MTYSMNIQKTVKVFSSFILRSNSAVVVLVLGSSSNWQTSNKIGVKQNLILSSSYVKICIAIFLEVG